MAKTKDTGSVDLQSKIEELNKRYGKGSVITLDKKIDGNYDVIPTGSIGVDYEVLGVGGFVLGRLYELRGWEGSGKSSICGHLSGEAQRKYPEKKVLYVDGEFALDKTYFQNLGVDTETLILVQPSNGEEGFTIAEELISTGEISLCIIDSDSSLLPKSLFDNDMEASNIGKKAKLNSTAYPKLKLKLTQNNTCVVVTSQYRQQVGMMFGDPKITQGGKALGFFADTIVEMSKKLKKEGDELSGNITTFKTIKNKTYSPHISSEFDLLFGTGIDKVGEIIKQANSLELIKVWGKSITHKETKYLYEDFESLLADNEEFYLSLKREIINNLKGIKPEENGNNLGV